MDKTIKISLLFTKSKVVPEKVKILSGGDATKQKEEAKKKKFCWKKKAAKEVKKSHPSKETPSKKK